MSEKQIRIGLILNILDEEYQTSVFSGIKKRCQEKNVDIICFQNENPLSLNQTIITKLPGKDFFNVDGIIILSSVFSDSPSIHSEASIRKIWPDIPVVSVGQKIQGIPSVSIRSNKAMNRLMDHLIKDHHYRNFLYVTGLDDLVDSMERKTVFENSIRKYQKKDPDITYNCISGHFNEVAAREVLAQYISSNPSKPADVIVCANDNMALGVNKYLKSQNTHSQWENCAVTGFDDIPQAAMEIPAFTTVHQPLEEMGSKALDIMLEALNGNVIEESFVDAKLIIRESCGCKMTSKNKAISEKHLVSIQRKFIQSEHQLKFLSHWGQQLNSITDTNGLMYALDTNLSALGIDNFALFSFPLISTENKISIDRLFSMTSLLFLRQNGERITQYGKVKKGNLAAFLSDLSENIHTHSLALKLLTSSTGETGFIIYDAPEQMHPHICSISTNIAQTIFRLQTNEQKQKYSEQLEKAVSKRTRELIAENNKRIEVEAEVLKISEMERQRFSTDLHDDICQRLAGLAMLCRCYSTSEKPISREQMVELTELITDTLQTTRQYAHNSFPVDLDSLGMKNSLSNLCNAFQSQSKCSCKYTWNLPENRQFSRPQAINIFRIIQEALQNIMKHAKATEAEVYIGKEKSKIIVRISDNGKGLANTRSQKQGIGMKSMSYRADQIEAKFTTRNNIPSGTIVELILPEEKLEKTKRKD